MHVTHHGHYASHSLPVVCHFVRTTLPLEVFHASAVQPGGNPLSSTPFLVIHLMTVILEDTEKGHIFHS